MPLNIVRKLIKKNAESISPLPHPSSTPTKTNTATTAVDDNDRYDRVLSGEALLAKAMYRGDVENIEALLAATNANWQAHYRPALEAAALFAQTLPASRNHHHAEAGGLLKHTLEVCTLALRLTKAEVLPPGTEPENIFMEGDRWRFGVFIAALCHDIGKVAADMEIAFSHDQGEWQHWDPLFGPMPVGARFAFRYPQRRVAATSTKSLHELLSAALLPHFLNAKTSRWLRSDPALMSEMLGAILEINTGSGTIYRLIRAADQASVGRSINVEKNANGAGIAPKHHRILKTLQALAKREEMKRNVPGGMLWVHPTGTWLVKGSGLELITQTMRQRGDDAIPQSKDLIAEILSEHQVTIPHPNTHATWQAVIKLADGSWEQKLTCLRFRHEDVWGDDIPPFLDAEITDYAGAVLEPLASATKKTSPRAEHGLINGGDEPTSAPAPVVSKATTEEATPAARNRKQTKDHDVSPPDPTQPTSPPQTVPEPTRQQQKGILKSNKKLIATSDFFAWLLEGISDHSVRVNEPQAFVHLVDGFIAIVSPAAFRAFVQCYRSSSNDNPATAIRAVQTEIKRLKLHEKNADGGDIFKVHIDGPHKKTAINAFLFQRERIRGLDHLANNPVMTLPQGATDRSS